VYDTSTNLEIITTIPDSSANIKLWKKSLSQAVIAFNVSKYNALLVQLQSEKKL